MTIHSQLCVNCDKPLTKREIDDLTEDDIKYHFKLCSKCKRQANAHTEMIVNDPHKDHRAKRR